MKKIHALLAAGVLMLGCACTLSGCGSNGDNSSDDKDGNGYADEIYLYNWSEYMTGEVLDQFEEEYGIKVVETTYESNDELLAKLIAGKEGEYDIASDIGIIIIATVIITVFKEFCLVNH